MKSLNKSQIEKMIPHAGKMCLIDEILDFNSIELTAKSNTHLDLENPLRFRDRLSVIASIEYVGQVVALHRYLTNNGLQSPVKPKIGYLAAIREANFYQQHL